MITLSIFLTLIGFELFYQCSKKAELNRSEKLAVWFQKNEVLAKTIGTIFFAIALNLSIIHLGIGSGIFTFFCILMLIGSLVVLISPLQKMKISWVMAGLTIGFLLEII